MVVRDAEDRGDNRFLEWRSKKKNVVIAFAGDNDRKQWRELHEFMEFTNNNWHEIQQDRRVIDRRDLYREDGTMTFTFR